ncbi:DUF11 domain-containing protein [Gemmata obscuriglobus]|uniref:DUF11 domain-containing protein n=1 Tax=Gemmata obscuriglobus TaxID=114 RepID=A0A2Z3GW27_9BACT|nr:DUF11 domain-containing protein [Gemmata obscuriglobus]
MSSLFEGEWAVRKRPIVLAAAVAVAGLAILGTVVAQQPTGTYPQPKVVPASGTLPGTAVRPYGDWTPTNPQPVSPAAGLGLGRPANTGTAVRPTGGATAAPAGQVPPAGYSTGSANRPRPGIAGADPIRPAGGFDVPAPSMEFPGAAPPAAAPTRPLPPPSLSLEPGESKFAAPSAPPGSSTPAPYVPVPPAPAGTPAPTGGAVPPPSFPPAGPSMPPVTAVPPATNPKPLPPLPNGIGASAPTMPTVPGPALAPAATPTVPAVTLPARMAQSVSVEAVCPDSVVFNTEAEYVIVVRNAGNVAVQHVRVEDELPAGCRYVSSNPPAELNGDRLVWALGALEANSDKRLAVRVRPTEEGELRSRATVTFSASVDAKTKVTRPRVAVAVVCPEVARAGEEPVFKIKVTNSGTGPAQQMVLQALLSDGLDFRNQGARLETKLANLPAGETRTVELPLNALKAGLQSCQVTVTADGSPEATAKASVNVVEPMLQVAQAGPVKCLVRAEPSYEITLSNPGTATTDAVTVYAVLPDGFDFLQASEGGAFNPATRAVTWKLQPLAAGGTKLVGLKLRAGAAGDVMLRTVAIAAPEAQPNGIAPVGGIPARAGRGLEAKAETAIKAEGVAALRFEVAGLENPVEVGKEAVYEIRVVNQGTGACTNVQVMAALADGTTYSGANGPTAGKATGQTLVFEPIPSLAVKGETVYRVRVRGNAAGEQRFRVQLTCDQVRNAVVKEECTRFYKE